MSFDYNTLNTKNHSAYRIFYQIVLSVKYRHKCITADIIVRLGEIFRDLLTQWDSRLVEFGGGIIKYLLLLSERLFCCDHCHVTIDRDLKAVKNPEKI